MKERKCVMCGAKLVLCLECGEPFHQRNETHLYCRGRCRTRKSRRLALERAKMSEIDARGHCT